MIYINARFLTQPITGVQRFAIEISKQLKLILKDEIKFISPNNILHIELAKQLGVVVTGTLKGHLWEQISLPAYLKKVGNPLLINLCNTGPILYQNKIITLHDIAFHVYPETFSKSFVFTYKTLIPLLIKSSKHILTVSEFSKKEIQNFYTVKAEDISVVYNAVDNYFTSKQDENLKAKRYLLAVCSLNHRKNLIGILKAYSKITDKESNTKLFIVGDISSKSFKTLDLSPYLNSNVEILGRISDQELVKYYSNAIGFVYPSFYEGFGIPPLEAQTCGCPVLLSNASCFPEVFGNSALYCHPDSVDSIANSMIQLINNREIRERLINDGFKNTKRYSWNKSAMKLVEITRFHK